LPDLLFQISVAPDAFLAEPARSGTVLGTLAKGSGAAAASPQPLQWVVPGWGCPFSEKPRFVMPSSPDYFKNLLSHEAFPAGRPEATSEALPLYDGKIPTVAQITGASSAAAGLILASTYFLEVALKDTVFFSSQGQLQTCLASAGLDAGLSCGGELTEDQCAAANGIVAAGLSGAAPCGGHLDEGVCRYPNVRLSDGAYADGHAVAMTVGHLQERFKQGPLRLIMTSWPQCKLPSLCVDHDLALLFRSEANAGVEPGGSMLFSGSVPFWELNGSATGRPRLSPQVFEMATWELNLRWVSLGTVDSAHSTLWYAKCTTLTVENRAFGVEAGRWISILLFQFSSTLPTDLYMSDYDEGRFELYPPAAQGIFNAIDRSSVVQDWLAETR
jgi:hypothetical protein